MIDAGNTVVGTRRQLTAAENRRDAFFDSGYTGSEHKKISAYPLFSGNASPSMVETAAVLRRRQISHRAGGVI